MQHCVSHLPSPSKIISSEVSETLQRICENVFLVLNETSCSNSPHQFLGTHMWAGGRFSICYFIAWSLHNRCIIRLIDYSENEHSLFARLLRKQPFHFFQRNDIFFVKINFDVNATLFHWGGGVSIRTLFSKLFKINNCVHYADLPNNITEFCVPLPDFNSLVILMYALLKFSLLLLVNTLH